MKILVTGVNGFIGQHLAQRLAVAGHEVAGLDIQADPGPPVAQYLQADLSNAIPELPACGVVVHLAAAGVKAKGRDWQSCTAVNVLGTQRLLYALSAMPEPPALLYTRTFYQNHLGKGIAAFDSNPYVATKEAAEQLIRLWQERDTNRRVVFGTVYQAYGPGDDSGNVLSYAAQKLRSGEKAEFGSGAGRRDWIFVDDLVAAIARATDQADAMDRGVEEYDFGSGELTSTRQMIERLAALADADPGLLNFDASRDRGDTQIEDRAARFLPGWRLEVSIDEGLKRLLKRTDIDG